MNSKTIVSILGIMTFVFTWAASVKAANLTPSGHGSLYTWLASFDGRDGTATAGMNKDPVASLARFYGKVGFQPVWTGPDGLLSGGTLLSEDMFSACRTGFFSQDYPLRDSETVWGSGVCFPQTIPVYQLEPYIRSDVMITHAMLQYAQHISQGWIKPESVFQQWHAWRRPTAPDIPAELAQALTEGRLAAYLESLHPQNRQYQALRKALVQYEQIRKLGSWIAIPQGPALRKDDRGDRVAVLRRRLTITGDLSSGMAIEQTPSDGTAVYDETVELAVKRFQQRHGMQADGIVGKDTLAQLNVPIEQRIIQLQLNMERLRWFPDSLGERYLLVNIPAFELRIIENQQTIERMRAIVGRKQRQTPVISGRMTYLEINPYWNIPGKIARKDILPKVIGDPEYLTRQGIRIFADWKPESTELDPAGVAWEKFSDQYFPYRLRQDPSSLNALGKIKFVFPNHLSVYIHDTPGKNLFELPVRDFSSGCIRVESPLLLAQYLLYEQGWDKSRLAAAIAKGERNALLLRRTIPVHLVYFTAWVDEDGSVNFREDIYGQDRKLISALKEMAPKRLICRNTKTANHPAHFCEKKLESVVPTAETPKEIAVDPFKKDVCETTSDACRIGLDVSALDVIAGYHTF